MAKLKMFSKFELVLPTEWGDDVFAEVEDIIKDKAKLGLYGWAKHEPDDNCSFEHYHIGCPLPSNRKLEDIVGWFDDITKDGKPLIRSNSIERIKSKKFDNYVVYLMHKTADAIAQGKTPPSEYGGTVDFEKAIADYDKVAKVNTLLDDIIRGNVKQYKYYNDIELMEIVNTIPGMRARVKNAFEDRERFEMKNMLNVEGKQQFWVYGNTGAGKTTLAKFICRQQGYSDDDIYITASGNNPFDNYMGEPCVILDDIDRNTMTAKVALKLFDLNTGSPTTARYYNKVLRAKIIIVTASVNPSDWWDSVSVDKTDGSKRQFFRRLNCGSWFINNNSMDIRIYDEEGNMVAQSTTDLPAEVVKLVKAGGQVGMAKTAISKLLGKDIQFKNTTTVGNVTATSNITVTVTPEQDEEFMVWYTDPCTQKAWAGTPIDKVYAKWLEDKSFEEDNYGF